VAVLLVSFDSDDLAFLPGNAELLRKATQELRVEARVKLVCVWELRQHAAGWPLDMREAVARDCNRMEHVMAERLGHAELATAQPVMVEWDDAECAADEAERVHVAFVRLSPTFESNAQLVRAAGGRNELRLVDAQRVIELLDRGDRRFANANDPDLVGFDECY